MLLNPKEPFIRAIYTNPRDLAPRLIYADWLQENGEEYRAEVIRRHCSVVTRHSPKHGSWGPKINDKNWKVRHARVLCGEVALQPIYEEQTRVIYGVDNKPTLYTITEKAIVASGCEWMMVRGKSTNQMYPRGATDSYVPREIPRFRLRLHRGFVRQVECNFEQFLKYSQTIADEHPVLRWVIDHCRPYYSAHEEQYSWTSHDSANIIRVASSILPVQVFDLLCGGRKEIAYNGAVRFYKGGLDGEIEAWKDLNQALLRFARREV